MERGVHNCRLVGAHLSRNGEHGYAIVELMVTIVIVSILAATVGTFFVKLLNIQEREREEAYIREKLADICGAYADAMSVGSSFGTRTNLLAHAMDMKVNYRQETGGVSLETGKVVGVTQMISSLNTTNKTLDSSIYGFKQGEFVKKLQRMAKGDAALMPLLGDMVSCTIRPLNYDVEGLDGDGYLTNNAALGYLEVKAEYKVKNKTGESEWKNATAGRVVRLWNKE